MGLSKLIFIAIFIYFIYLVFKVIKVVFSKKPSNVRKERTRTSGRNGKETIDKKDIIDADFVEIKEEKEKQ